MELRLLGERTEELNTSLNVLVSGRSASCTVCAKHIQFISHDMNCRKIKTKEHIHTVIQPTGTTNHSKLDCAAIQHPVYSMAAR